MEFWLPIVTFIIGMLFTLLLYIIMSALVGEDDKFIVYKSRRLSKRERIEKLECKVESLEQKFLRLDNPIFLSQFEYYRKCGERNKNK